MRIRLDGFHVIFNGPSQVGKTTLGSMLVEASGAEAVEFKERLVSVVLALMNVTRSQWDEWYEDDKDKKRPQLLMRSCRGAQQLVSEKMIKPALGAGFFGSVAASDASYHQKGTVYLDGGFDSELAEVVRAHSADRVIVIRLHGNCGKGYEKKDCRPTDTRHYLQKESHPKVGFIDIDNSGQINTVFRLMEKEIDDRMDIIRGAI